MQIQEAVWIQEKAQSDIYVFIVGGTTISYMSSLQKSVALLTIEAEYMAIIEASKELIWLNNFLSKLGMQLEDCVLYFDNQSTVHLAKNLAFHNRMKHIQMKYHFICELIIDGTLDFKLCTTSTGLSST